LAHRKDPKARATFSLDLAYTNPICLSYWHFAGHVQPIYQRALAELEWSPFLASFNGCDASFLRILLQRLSLGRHSG
jgi:hypothetical protein